MMVKPAKMKYKLDLWSKECWNYFFFLIHCTNEPRPLWLWTGVMFRQALRWKQTRAEWVKSGTGHCGCWHWDAWIMHVYEHTVYRCSHTCAQIHGNLYAVWTQTLLHIQWRKGIEDLIFHQLEPSRGEPSCSRCVRRRSVFVYPLTTPSIVLTFSLKQALNTLT